MYARGGVARPSIGQNTSSKFFNPVLILISALALSISAAACGGSDDKPVDSDADSGVAAADGGVVNECEAAGHFGPNCGECTGNFWGPNCDQDTITCKNGTPAIGIYGNGQCASCEANTGWTGDNCDQCGDGWTGENCNFEKKCVHGTLDPETGLR